MCDKFYMFEPICTMLLLAMCFDVHVIRIYAIIDKTGPILAALSALLLLQVSCPILLHFELFPRSGYYLLHIPD
jgi:hypothetical protein